jgi:hypothetical protein
MSRAVDLYVVYLILKKLVTPFKEWDAYKEGVIDERGKIILDKKERDRSQKDTLTEFDKLIRNLKLIIEKLPFGKTKLASFTAALLLLKEEEQLKTLDQEQLEELFNEQFKTAPKTRQELIERVSNEEMVTTSGVAGLGDNPPVRMGKFANNDVFIVGNEVIRRSRLGKKKYTRYEKYVGNDSIGNAIREFGRKYPKKPIILQDDKTGEMIFLRYGGSGKSIFKEEVDLNEDIQTLFEEGEITQSVLNDIEKYADKLFAKLGIDVEFTRHFLDRVNDTRNKKQITQAELIRLFKQTHKQYGKKIAQLGPDAQAVLTDMQTDVNMPFVLKWDSKSQELDLVAKTVMRKKNFATSNDKFSVR